MLPHWYSWIPQLNASDRTSSYKNRWVNWIENCRMICWWTSCKFNNILKDYKNKAFTVITGYTSTLCIVLLKVTLTLFAYVISCMERKESMGRWNRETCQIRFELVKYTDYKKLHYGYFQGLELTSLSIPSPQAPSLCFGHNTRKSTHLQEFASHTN